MATARVYVCPNCGRQPEWPSLFAALQRLAEGCITPCPKCRTGMQLQLTFDFALGATGKDTVAIASFLPKPPPQWKDADRDVILYPFLVILEREETKRAAWLPYFHVVRSDKKTTCKYGQWAPFMDITLFEDLLRQAHEAGHLLGVSSGAKQSNTT